MYVTLKHPLGDTMTTCCFQTRRVHPDSYKAHLTCCRDHEDAPVSHTLHCAIEQHGRGPIRVKVHSIVQLGSEREKEVRDLHHKFPPCVVWGCVPQAHLVPCLHHEDAGVAACGVYLRGHLGAVEGDVAAHGLDHGGVHVVRVDMGDEGDLEKHLKMQGDVCWAGFITLNKGRSTAVTLSQRGINGETAIEDLKVVIRFNMRAPSTTVDYPISPPWHIGWI